MRCIRYNFWADCVVCNEALEGGCGMVVIRRPKFFGALFSIAVGAMLSIVVVAPGMIADNGKVIKKVPTTHKVVSL